MYSTSNEYKQAVAQNSRQWRILMQAELDDGEILSLSNKDIVSGTFSYDESSICSDNFDIGATYSNGIEFSLQNFDKRFTNKTFAYAKITVKIGILTGEEIWEDIPLGVFFVSEDGKKLSTIPLKALDRMYMLNESIKKITILPNSTPHDIMISISDKFGFVIEDETDGLIDNMNLTFPAFDADITCRDFIGYLAAILGKSARFNRTGNLEFYSVSDTIYETSSENRTSMSTSDFAVKITGVQISDANKETYFMGTDDYVIEIDSNPLLINENITAEALNNAYSVLSETEYTPYTCSIISDPSIQCGDRVKHINKDGSYIESIITNFTFTLRGDSQIEAKGQAPQSSRQLTQTAKKIIEVSQKASEDLNTGLTNMQDIILKQSSLITSSLGFWPYTRYNEDGSVRDFNMMDNKDPELAKVVWKFTSNGIGLSKTGIDGEVITSGWTVDDSILAQVITADLIKTGTLKAIDELLSIDLSNGKFETQTSFGTCTIQGNDIVLKYQDQTTGVPVSYLKLSADTVQSDKAVNMKITLASTDNTISSSIEQRFEYDPETGLPTKLRPLTISSSQGVVLEKDFMVRDSIVYDNIKMQRKYKEYGNTGVDFIFAKQPIIPPDNLFTQDSNPGFEQSKNSYDPWILHSGASDIVSIASDVKHSGSNSLKITAGIVYIKAPVKTPNKNFYIGCWMRTTGEIFSGAILISPTQDDSNKHTIFEGNMEMHDNWVYMSSIVENDEEKFIYLGNSADGINYWDDFFMCTSDGYSKEQLDEYVLSLYKE